jgi:hypothetical protein
MTTDTTQALREAAESDSWFRAEVVRRALRLGASPAQIDGEGPHFRYIYATYYLGREGWTVADVQMAAA